MSTIRGEWLVNKWARRFGLGHYRLTVQLISPTVDDAWAMSYFDLEEEWGVIDLPADDAFPPETLELLVLHELAHGLIALSQSGHDADEAACNRIARLALSDWNSPMAQEQRAQVLGDAFYVEATEKSAVTRHDWLAIVADALPEEQRTIISLLYYEGVSIRDAARRTGLTRMTIQRRRDQALRTLNAYFKALDNKFAKEGD